MKRILIVAGLCALTACADVSAKIAGEATKISPVLQTACNDAMMVANLAGLVPGVGVIVPYITAGCATAEGLTKLAADPTSTQWLGTMIGQIQGLASKVGIKLPASA